jgi:hypothetical protein
MNSLSGKFKWISCLFLIYMPPVSSTQTYPEINSLKNRDGFAVVELFTSEGCSSCPPAEEVVGRLNGLTKNIFLLSFHVDYWNYLGWKDVYSSPAYTNRQQEYGAIFHLNSIYTPQIVINGKAQFVGSDESRLKESISSSISEIPATEIHINVQRPEKNQIPVTWNQTISKGFKLNISLVQHTATNYIQAGENKGRTLIHSYIVRDFQSDASQNNPGVLYLKIPPGLSTAECDVIAFLQNEKTGEIIAATRSEILGVY